MTEKRDTWIIADEFISITEQTDGTYGISSNSASEEFEDDKPFMSFSLEHFPTREDALDAVLLYLEGAEISGEMYSSGETVHRLD